MDLDMRLVWFVLAGFLLGFSISTLWEWLYFRRRRVSNVAGGVSETPRRENHLHEHAQGGAVAAGQQEKLRNRRGDGGEGVSVVQTEDDAHSPYELVDDEDDPERWRAGYESPGVYLEAELDQPDAEEDEFPPARAGQSRGPGGNAGSRRSGQHSVAQPNDLDAFEEDVMDEFDEFYADDLEDGDEDADQGPVDFVVRERSATPPGRPGATQEDRPSRGDAGADVNRLRGLAIPPPSQSAAGRASGRQAPAEHRPPTARSTRPSPPERLGISQSEPRRDGQTEPAGQPSEQQLSPAPVRRNRQEPEPFRGQSSAGSSLALRKTANYPDDLAKIKGIGEIYKQRLYAAGIYTWHQIVETDEEILREATQAYPSSNVHEWAEQARQLAEKNGRTGALYTGPKPNDLTQIYGIGPVGASTLNKIGICTYAQLAQLAPEQLAPHFPVAVAGDEPNFAHWIAQARQRVDERT